MTLRTKLAGLLLLAGAAGGGVAAVQYARTAGHSGGESCCRTEPRTDDPNADRPLIEPEGDDKKLADTQAYCPVMTDTKLGEMGPPVKVIVKGADGREEPVFVCCKGCKRKALADPDKTLAAVAALKAAAPK
jgi:hypothetical protein